MNTLLEITEQTIRKEGLFSKGDRVLVALSGGADSVALLYALWLLKEPWNLTLTAAHLHHGIRGKEADADCRLAEEFCQKLQIPCLVQQVNIPAICAQTGEGEEECGRRMRYEFFDSVENIDKIATAHTANDNAETLLLHLARGTGVRGLRGILPKRGNLVRPLIDCSRDMVEEFCKEHRLPFANDSSNADCTYRRNYIRHKVLPLFREINPSLLERLGDCAKANQKDFDYLQKAGEQLLQDARRAEGYALSVLQKAHPSPLFYALESLLQEYGLSLLSYTHFEQLSQLIQKGEGKCTLPGELTACVFQELFILERKKGAFTPPPIAISPSKRHYEYCQKQIALERRSISCENVCNLLTYNGVDSDKIGTQLQLRTRLPGDVITLPRRGCTKSLKKLFNEHKIPHARRERTLVLCDEQGILWVEGFGCDARCAPTRETKNILTITIQER